MELITVNRKHDVYHENKIHSIRISQPVGKTKAANSSQFIKANSSEVSLFHLKKECNIPVFARDNEQTISHGEFIDQANKAVETVFPGELISEPAIRVSHMIKGRTPDAVGLPVKELKENQKTIYYERMAFLISLPNITTTVQGNELMLSVGGVRAYNTENLYSKKVSRKIQVFHRL